MGYQLHITRADDWIDSENHPIPRAEWHTFADSRPDLRREGTVTWGDIGEEPIFEHTCTNGSEVSLWWREGEVKIAGAYDREAIDTLYPMARELGANLIGDDGEHYPE